MVLAKLIKRSAMPPWVISCPESTKKGIARSAKLSRPVPIRWAIVVTAAKLGMEINMVKSEEIAILHATGVPIDIKKIKLSTSTITGNKSINLYFSL
jgi:hypothetical protein